MKLKKRGEGRIPVGIKFFHQYGTHLLPETEKEPRRYILIALAAGILVAVMIASMK